MKRGYLRFASIGAAFAAGVVVGPLVAAWAQEGGRAETYRLLNLFGDVFERVRAEYVEPVNDRDAIENAIQGMLSSLDPHSSYLNQRSFRDMQTQTRGEFGGLGIEVTQEGGYIKVISPIDETPAARAGVRPGDFITHLNGTSVQGLTLQEAVDQMRGQRGTQIKLTIRRQGAERPIELTLTRDVIRPQVVRFRLENGDLGYVRVTSFNEQTEAGLRRALQQLKGQATGGLKGLILDLRNNPGGLLDQSIAVSNAFLSQGEIVSTRGRNADETQRYNARPGDLSKGKPVIVLINGGSASASEIVAGALQDHKRATIVGTRSFGKGSVQTIIPLGQANGALRLTTARYYTPSGRSIQAKGIDPDIQILQDVPDELKGKDDTKGEASLKGHLKNGEEEKSGSQAYVPPDPKNDKQLKAAMEMLRGTYVKAQASEPAKAAERNAK